MIPWKIFSDDQIPGEVMTPCTCVFMSLLGTGCSPQLHFSPVFTGFCPLNWVNISWPHLLQQNYQDKAFVNKFDMQLSQDTYPSDLTLLVCFSAFFSTSRPCWSLNWMSWHWKRNLCQQSSSMNRKPLSCVPPHRWWRRGLIVDARYQTWGQQCFSWWPV